MFLGFATPSSSNTSCSNQGGTVTTQDNNDDGSDGPGTGGDTGQLPPPK